MYNYVSSLSSKPPPKQVVLISLLERNVHFRMPFRAYGT